MTSESSQPVDEPTKILQYGGSRISLAGRKSIGTIVLTDRDLAFIPAYGPKRFIALISIDAVEPDGEDLILKSDRFEIARFGVYDRKERKEWIEAIENARNLAKQRGDSIQEELPEPVAAPIPSLLNWVYLAGNPNYYDSFATGLVLKPDGLELTSSNPPLLVPYQDIEGFELIPSKQTTTTRIFLAGPLLASAWKKMEWFLCIRYKDNTGITLSLVFQPTSLRILEEFVRDLYWKMRQARSK